jgi:hypothetical protein
LQASGTLILFFLTLGCLSPLGAGEVAGAAGGNWKFEEDDGGSHLVQTVELGSQAAEEDITQLEMRKSVTAAAPPTLRALSPNSGMMEAAAVIVRIENDEVMDIAMSGLRAREWVARNIVPYTRTIHIAAITVGNEIIEHAVEEDEEKAKLSMFLLPAMRNVVKALVYWELDKEIKVSTRTSMLLLCSNCSPPSSGSFNPTHMHLVQELLDFLSKSQAPFVINVDAFHLYIQASSSSAQQQPPVQYFVFEPNSGLNDTVSRLHYSNFLEAVLDCVFLAMAAVVNQTHEKTMNIPITVALNSWPSSHELATTFNANLFNHLQFECQHQGTPLKPDAEIHIYINDDDGLGVAGISSLPTTNDLLSSSSSSSSSTPSDHPRQQQSPHLRRLLQQEEWCVAKSGQAQTALQAALDWACGTGQGQGQVDCSAIQSTGVCYLPNDLQDHCSWAFNQYFQAHSTGTDSCDFGGTATFTTSNPSKASSSSSSSSYSLMILHAFSSLLC